MNLPIKNIKNNPNYFYNKLFKKWKKENIFLLLKFHLNNYYKNNYKKKYRKKIKIIKKYLEKIFFILFVINNNKDFIIKLKKIFSNFNQSFNRFNKKNIKMFKNILYNRKFIMYIHNKIKQYNAKKLLNKIELLNKINIYNKNKKEKGKEKEIYYKINNTVLNKSLKDYKLSLGWFIFDKFKIKSIFKFQVDFILFPKWYIFSFVKINNLCSFKSKYLDRMKNIDNYNKKEQLSKIDFILNNFLIKFFSSRPTFTYINKFLKDYLLYSKVNNLLWGIEENKHFINLGWFLKLYGFIWLL